MTGNVVSGLNYVYRDAGGKELVSMVPLPCPAFVGHTDGKVAEHSLRIRSVTGRVESIEERLNRLESENSELRVALEQRPPIDLGALAAWIEEQVVARLPHQPVTVVQMPVAEEREKVGLDRPVEEVIEAEFEVKP